MKDEKEKREQASRSNPPETDVGTQPAGKDGATPTAGTDAGKDAGKQDSEQEREQPAAKDAGSKPDETDAGTDADKPSAAPEVSGAGKELAALKDQFLRLGAEYDNYRKRTAREKESLWQEAKIDTIQKFLPIYDNLERAAAVQGDDDNPHKKGLVMILQQYREALKAMGVTEIDAAGKPFDPERHNAVMHVDDENLGENVVAQVFQAGFLLGDRVIRHATVQVAN